jgi:predicted nucleic acid-binding Zn ribbon protein
MGQYSRFFILRNLMLTFGRFSLKVYLAFFFGGANMPILRIKMLDCGTILRILMRKMDDSSMESAPSAAHSVNKLDQRPALRFKGPVVTSTTTRKGHSSMGAKATANVLLRVRRWRRLSCCTHTKNQLSEPFYGPQKIIDGRRVAQTVKDLI